MGRRRKSLKRSELTGEVFVFLLEVPFNELQNLGQRGRYFTPIFKESYPTPMFIFYFVL